MSVRNILDGTIKVGSGGEVMPVEPEIPENLQVTSVKASGSVSANSVETRTLTAETNITVGDLIVARSMTTPNLTVDSREVLTLQHLGDKLTMTGLKADGKTTVSFETSPRRWLYNIYPDLHMLVTTFSITTEPLSQLTIPTELTCGDQVSWWGKTLLKADDQFLDCVMQLIASDGKLVIKIDIPTASTYTNIIGKISVPFY